MEFCRIKEEDRRDVKDILSKLHQGEMSWTTIRQELRAPPMSLSSTSLDDLARFDWRGLSIIFRSIQELVPLTIDKL